jgi:Tfp pilus tip-associated adhesin PilY1
MIITQPKLVPMGNGRSLMAFTSFLPKASGCGDFGDGYLYLVDTFTGLPDPKTYSLFTTAALPNPASSPLGGRVAGGITTGKGSPTEAFVIVSAAGVTVSASAPDASTTSIFMPIGSVPRSSLTSWKEVLDFGFELSRDSMFSDL